MQKKASKSHMFETFALLEGRLGSVFVGWGKYQWWLVFPGGGGQEKWWPAKEVTHQKAIIKKPHGKCLQGRKKQKNWNVHGVHRQFYLKFAPFWMWYSTHTFIKKNRMDWWLMSWGDWRISATLCDIILSYHDFNLQFTHNCFVFGNQCPRFIGQKSPCLGPKKGGVAEL